MTVELVPQQTHLKAHNLKTKKSDGPLIVFDGRTKVSGDGIYERFIVCCGNKANEKKILFNLFCCWEKSVPWPKSNVIVNKVELIIASTVADVSPTDISTSTSSIPRFQPIKRRNFDNVLVNIRRQFCFILYRYSKVEHCNCLSEALLWYLYQEKQLLPSTQPVKCVRVGGNTCCMTWRFIYCWNCWRVLKTALCANAVVCATRHRLVSVELALTELYRTIWKK